MQGRGCRARSSPTCPQRDQHENAASTTFPPFSVLETDELRAHSCRDVPRLMSVKLPAAAWRTVLQRRPYGLARMPPVCQELGEARLGAAPLSRQPSTAPPPGRAPGRLVRRLMRLRHLSYRRPRRAEQHRPEPSPGQHRPGLCLSNQSRDFPGGAVVRSPPAIAGDTGSIPGPGRVHMPRSS